jgi:hypothetical protein
MYALPTRTKPTWPQTGWCEINRQHANHGVAQTHWNLHANAKLTMCSAPRRCKVCSRTQPPITDIATALALPPWSLMELPEVLESRCERAVPARAPQVQQFTARRSQSCLCVPAAGSALRTVVTIAAASEVLPLDAAVPQLGRLLCSRIRLRLARRHVVHRRHRQRACRACNRSQVTTLAAAQDP